MTGEGRQRGQAMVLAVVLLTMALTLFLFLCQVGITVRDKIRLQTAADYALLSALSAQANALNALAVGNRAILAQDALAARFNALACEASFTRKLLENVSWLVRLIPYAGPVMGQALTQGGKAVELAARYAARAAIPVTGPADSLLSAQGAIVRASLVALPPRAAAESLRINEPKARLSPLSLAALLRQGRDLQRAISPLPGSERNRLLRETLDHRTARRDWSTGIPGMPIRKQGGTDVGGRDFRAYDWLQFKVWKKGRWRWRNILSAGSDASEFGYRGHGELLTIDGEAIPPGLTFLLTRDAETPLPMAAPSDLPISAVSSGRLVYRRPDRPSEKGNLFNPFWGVRLIPVAEEEGVRKLVPGTLLREILH